MSRNAALRGSPIELTAVFLDAAGDYADPSNISISIYPPGKDPRQGALPADAWVYGATTIDPGTGPEADPLVLVIRVAEGRYRYTFTVPSDADLGASFDNWQGIIDLESLDETFTFTVVGGGSVGVAQILENNVVYILLDKDIADLSGNTLGTDYTSYFTTTYNPLYTSIRRIKLDIGPVIRDVPDDTINLAIFEAGLHADALSFGTPSLTGSALRYYLWAKRQFVVCMAEVILLSAVLADAGTGGGGKSKRLADLDVSYGNSGDAQKAYDRALKCVDKWRDVLTSSGEIGPGTSQRPSMVIKGDLDPDRPPIGRGWEPTSSWSGAMPASNTHSRYVYKRRWKRDYISTRWTSRFSKEYE